MSELIRKDEARAALLRKEPGAAYCIDRIKPVDAVEVVRCKDCKHYAEDKHFEGEGYCNHFGYYSYAPEVEMDGFCSYGERRCEDGK